MGLGWDGDVEQRLIADVQQQCVGVGERGTHLGAGDTRFNRDAGHVSRLFFQRFLLHPVADQPDGDVLPFARQDLTGLDHRRQALGASEIARIEDRERRSLFGVGGAVGKRRFHRRPVADHAQLRGGDTARRKRVAHAFRLSHDQRGAGVSEGAHHADRGRQAVGATQPGRAHRIGPQVLHVQNERQAPDAPGQRRRQADRDRRVINISEVEPPRPQQAINQHSEEEGQEVQRPPDRRMVMAGVKRQASDAHAFQHLVLDRSHAISGIEPSGGIIGQAGHDSHLVARILKRADEGQSLDDVGLGLEPLRQIEDPHPPQGSWPLNLSGRPRNPPDESRR